MQLDSVVSEVIAVGTAAVRLPAALRRRGCTAERHGSSAGGGHWPVVLVHGYAGSHLVWGPLRQVLAAAGFDAVVTVSYDSFGVPVDEVTRCIAGLVRDAAPGAHLVGHSLGGLLVRRAITDHALAGAVGAAVTISTPHGGSPFARFAVGHCARLMLPGSVGGTAAPAGPRWLSFAADGDRVVPPSSARLTGPALGARNVLVRGRGHLTVCRDPHLLRTLVDHLRSAEQLATSPVPTALAA